MQVKNILIVDDDADDSEFFTMVMEELAPAIKVSVASSKEELFENIKQTAPDLIFIDSFIQQDSGVASIKEIRANKGFEQLPIIMYTGSAHTPNISRAFEAGASFYIVKPHTLAEIKKVLKYVLEHDWSKAASAPVQYYMDGQLHYFEE